MLIFIFVLVVATGNYRYRLTRPLYPQNFRLRLGSQCANTRALTQVSGRGGRTQPTTLQLERHRVYDRMRIICAHQPKCETLPAQYRTFL
ncbi:MAG TPA: hypothetical protein DHV72_18115 [Serratia grimesii]|uniref:Uncharacterized protein n=1 Tax=Serratia grimesii TaxID=82995 RepID=A0A9C7QXK4_9GAMM|nr:hypothetical protein [Serratia grimesii]